jgi:hypothetical protein
MTEARVDVEAIRGRRRLRQGIQARDGPRLHDEGLPAFDAPLDILRLAIVRFDAPPERDQHLHGRIVQHARAPHSLR